MSFLRALKTFLSRSKKEKKRHGEIKLPQIKDLKEFRPMTNQIVQEICDIKLILIATADSDHGPLDRKQFCIKLSSFVKNLKQNDALKKYVHCVYPEHQRQKYYLIVEELSRTCDELCSELKNMEFFNTRNARVAEMMTEVTHVKSCHREKRAQLCSDLEKLLENRLMHKWSILKTSNDKKLLEQFLKEIKGQEDAIEFCQKKVKNIMWTSMRAASRASDFTTKTCKYERLVQSVSNDRNHEVADDINCADKLNDSFTSISVTDSPSSAQLD